MIQNTANRHVSNAFDLKAAFISFCPWRAAVAAAAAADFCCCCCAPSHPTPPPLFGGGKCQKKRKSPVASAWADGHVFVGVGVVTAAFCFAGGFGVLWARRGEGRKLPPFLYDSLWACLPAVCFVTRRVDWLAWRRRLASAFHCFSFFVFFSVASSVFSYCADATSS
jgi:hypothetical protein